MSNLIQGLTPEEQADIDQMFLCDPVELEALKKELLTFKSLPPLPKFERHQDPAANPMFRRTDWLVKPHWVTTPIGAIRYPQDRFEADQLRFGGF
jgi:hypothetical protein